ncbi:hypothetical protein B0H14DRAFT_3177614 [Mycena olivaceomarginata]|nr:hypothetical protein B0H14DRAFT_3177614 [Mycena olivaceomarginata]
MSKFRTWPDGNRFKVFVINHIPSPSILAHLAPCFTFGKPLHGRSGRLLMARWVLVGYTNRPVPIPAIKLKYVRRDGHGTPHTAAVEPSKRSISAQVLPAHRGNAVKARYFGYCRSSHDRVHPRGECTVRRGWCTLSVHTDNQNSEEASENLSENGSLFINPVVKSNVKGISGSRGAGVLDVDLFHYSLEQAKRDATLSRMHVILPKLRSE